MPKFSQRSKDALKGVHPDLVRLMEAAIADSPVDFTIVEGVRTAERQKLLYAQGRTVKGKIVTNVDGVIKKSNHQVKSDGYGYAVDLYPFVGGKLRITEPYVIPKLREISTHIKAKAAKLGIKIVWGGDWKKPYDPPHFQLA